MAKRALIVVLCVLSLILCGCSSTKEIDKASLAETVTAGEKNGKIYYTFYLLSGEEKPKFASVPASSFEEACALAKKEYIPNLSLSKLELFITEENISTKTLKKDVEYIAKTPYFSPLMYVTLCDSRLIENLTADKEIPTLIEDHIILLKNKNKGISENCLSIFNNFFSADNKEFSVSYINSEKELKAIPMKISAENEKNNKNIEK